MQSPRTRKSPESRQSSYNCNRLRVSRVLQLSLKRGDDEHIFVLWRQACWQSESVPGYPDEWPAVAADSLRGPFWGLGGAGLWTRDLCCLFTFSWFGSLWLTSVLLCQHPMFHLDLLTQVGYICVRVRETGSERRTDRKTGCFRLGNMEIMVPKLYNLILWNKKRFVRHPLNIQDFRVSLSNTSYMEKKVAGFLCLILMCTSSHRQEKKKKAKTSTVHYCGCSLLPHHGGQSSGRYIQL